MCIEGQSFDFYFHDIIQCIRALYSDVEFAHYLVFASEQHWDEHYESRLYYDMHIGNWWWALQVYILL